MLHYFSIINWTKHLCNDGVVDDDDDATKSNDRRVTIGGITANWWY